MGSPETPRARRLPPRGTHCGGVGIAVLPHAHIPDGDPGWSNAESSVSAATASAPCVAGASLTSTTSGCFHVTLLVHNHEGHRSSTRRRCYSKGSPEKPGPLRGRCPARGAPPARLPSTQSKHPENNTRTTRNTRPSNGSAACRRPDHRIPAQPALRAERVAVGVVDRRQHGLQQCLACGRRRSRSAAGCAGGRRCSGLHGSSPCPVSAGGREAVAYQSLARKQANNKDTRRRPL